MAFPQVQATSTGNDTTSGSGAVTLPTGVTAGDRLVMVVDVDNGNLSDIIISASGTGWNKLAQESDAGAVRSALFEKQSASGDSADAVTLSFSGQSIAEACSYTVYRISGHDSSAALEYAVQSHTDVGDTNPSANPDAPSLTPSWGSADTLWMWVGCWDNATRTISAFPTNYSSNQTTNTGASGASGDVTIAIATRENAASSEDPGTATISAAEQWNAWTIAIKPAGGGDVTAPVLTSAAFAATGSSTGTASVSTDEGNGTLYCVVTTSSTSPSAAQIKAGNDHTGSAAAFDASQAVSGTGTQNVSVTGLSPSTTYYAHFVQDDAAANESNVASDSTGDATDAADVTAPTLSSPVGTATGTTTATVGATTDEGNGTMYAVVTVSGTAPSAAQIKAGQDNSGSAAAWSGSQAISTVGAKTFSATGLVAATAYYAHVVHTDAASNDSNVVTSSQFTTDAVASDNIRLQPSLYLERGGYAASLTADRWIVFTSDLSAVENTGTALSINSTGQPTIDITGSASYVVGDQVPLFITVYDEGSNPEDRTVRTFFGWVEAIAQA